jgi:hypothetical protein
MFALNPPVELPEEPSRSWAGETGLSRSRNGSMLGLWSDDFSNALDLLRWS